MVARRVGWIGVDVHYGTLQVGSLTLRTVTDD